LKPVAWRKKMPSDETPESQPTKQIIVARFTQTACARKGQTVRTDSGTSYRLSKSDKPPCPAERRCEQLKEYTGAPTGCQRWILRFPQPSSGDPSTPLPPRFDGSSSDAIQGFLRGLRVVGFRTYPFQFYSLKARRCDWRPAATMGGHGAGLAQQGAGRHRKAGLVARR
jgi:hypothetical protein